MLVLERLEGETTVLTVGEHRIVVTLIEVRKGCKARIGFAAPLEVRILRGELEPRKDGAA